MKNTQVEILRCTPKPQNLCVLAMHNDYSEKYIGDEPEWLLKNEKESGEILINKCLKFGHWGIIEHPQITLGYKGFPHSVIQQLRTHRTGITFDVQCLSKDTKIKTSNEEWITIEELHNLKEKPQLRTYCEETKSFINGKIDKTFNSGIKDLYLVTLEDGKKIKSTLDHKFLTNKGWKRLKELNIGDNLLCNGTPMYGVKKEIQEARTKYYNKNWLENQLKTKKPKQIANELNVSYNTIQKYCYKYNLTWDKSREGERKRKKIKKWSQFKDKPFTYGHIRWWMKNNSSKIIKTKGSKCELCNKKTDLVLHHLIPISVSKSLAYHWNNLQCLCRRCHCIVHKPRLTSKEVKISSIIYIGQEETYDIAMVNKPHNFIAEGIIVHNSMRYTGKRFAKWYYDIRLNKFSDEAFDEFEKLFYIRPIGIYSDRFGNKIDFDEHKRKKALRISMENFYNFVLTYLIKDKMPNEMFRDFIPAGYKQNFVMSCNARTLCHLLDLRLPKNAQNEISCAMEKTLELAKVWMPEVFNYYEKTRAGKNKIAP